MRLFFLLFLALVWAAAPARAETPAPQPGSLFPTNAVPKAVTQSSGGVMPGETARLKMKVDELENNLGRLEAEMEVFKAQAGLLIGRSQLTFRNATYGRAGFTLLFPRYSTYPFRMFGYGIGVFAGVGHYFGKNHIVDFEVASDMQLAATVRYRFEIQLGSPSLVFGPVVGYRVSIGKTFVDDAYIERPELLKKNWYVLGFLVGLPIGKSVIAIELDYFTNSQSSIYANAGLHFFF